MNNLLNEQKIRKVLRTRLSSDLSGVDLLGNLAKGEPIVTDDVPTILFANVGTNGAVNGTLVNVGLSRTSSTADPTTGDIPSGYTSIHKNTTSGNVFLAYNDGGAIKKVQLV